MKYVLFIIVGLILFIYFQKWKKARERKPVQKTQIRERQIGHAICPYCKSPLEDRPKRSKKCPKCQSKIMVKAGRLLTEEQAAAYDAKELAKQRKSIEANNMSTLRNYKKSGAVKYVEIVGGGQNSCPACKRVNGKRFRLKDELRNPTLPVKNCTSDYGYCRCCYAPVVK